MKFTVFALFATTALFGQSPELRMVDAAAQALGGKDKLLSLQSLTVYGYGQLAYQDGGGNIVASPEAPQKWINIMSAKRTVDLMGGRMRAEQRQYQDFVFAYAASMTGGQRTNQFIDGNIAFNLTPDRTAQRAGEAAARQRRIEMLDNPAMLIRTALDAKSKLSGLRKDGARKVVDLTTPLGDQVSFAVDEATNLPAWMQWVGPHMNYGDVTYRTHYLGYQDEQGVRLPFGYNTVMDFRNVVYRKFYVDRYGVNEASPQELAALVAPSSVRNVTPPAAPAYNIEAVPVVKGIWYMKGGAGNSTLYEFADHLTLFECYGNEASTLAIIAKARQTVPGKPVTQCIVSHHHIDHSGGVRAAVSEGLEIVTHRGNAAYFQEVTSRPAKLFPDALARNPKPLKILAVDEHLKLKDGAMEVDLYRAISNTHMANGIFAHVPGVNLVSQGDFTDEGWDQSFWANTYPASVAYWKLTVARDLSVHGNMHTWPEVLDQLRAQVKGAQALCERVEASGLPLQGCPVNNFVQ